MPAGLAARLKDETRREHEQAERAGIMRDLLQGQIQRGIYVTIPPCDIYVRRLRTIENDSPELLISHAYVRYLSDLSYDSKAVAPGKEPSAMSWERMFKWEWLLVEGIVLAPAIAELVSLHRYKQRIKAEQEDNSKVESNDPR